MKDEKNQLRDLEWCPEGSVLDLGLPIRVVVRRPPRGSAPRRLH